MFIDKQPNEKANEIILFFAFTLISGCQDASETAKKITVKTNQVNSGRSQWYF